MSQSEVEIHSRGTDCLSSSRYVTYYINKTSYENINKVGRSSLRLRPQLCICTCIHPPWPSHHHFSLGYLLFYWKSTALTLFTFRRIWTDIDKVPKLLHVTLCFCLITVIVVNMSIYNNLYVLFAQNGSIYFQHPALIDNVNNTCCAIEISFNQTQTELNVSNSRYHRIHSFTAAPFVCASEYYVLCFCWASQKEISGSHVMIFQYRKNICLGVTENEL